ncbi:hypothetical protein NL492_26620, partial [Klebsiella pneumoniae]|nr:hypothetical protein [Klebsiella pneumoniae]
VGEQLEKFVLLFDRYLRPNGHTKHFAWRFRQPPGFPSEPHRLLVYCLGFAEQFAEQQFFFAKILHVELLDVGRTINVNRPTSALFTY